MNDAIIINVSCLVVLGLLFTFLDEIQFTSKFVRREAKIVPVEVLSNKFPVYKPTIYTYIDEAIHDEELFQLWKKVWLTFNWKIRVLSPSDAKKHPKFEEYSQVLDSRKLCCLPRITYERLMAMSTIEEGGLFSEPYVFPLSNHEFITSTDWKLANGGNFTSLDGNIGSLMSGSQSEWNRATDLIMEHVSKNIVFSLKSIQTTIPDAIIFSDDIMPPSLFLTETQFKVNICTLHKNFSGIRFHTGDLRHFGLATDDRTDIAKSWFKIYKAKCLSDRPTMFTFFEPVDYLSHEDPGSLLKLWEASWSNAGWNPIILNLADAKRNPKFNNYHEILGNSQLFRNGNDKYNQLCFIRWAAAAASFGGWMSDYDTFPLKNTIPKTLPNSGMFTGHSHVNPNLLSGNATEWNRLTELLFTSLKDHNTDKVFSDLFALRGLYFNRKSILTDKKSMEISEFYTNELNLNYPFDLADRCDIANTSYVVHFSHFSCSHLEFCSHGNKKHQQRSEVIQIWLNEWMRQCS